MNKVILVGNLGSDSELTTTSSGSQILKFSLATTEKWKSDGEKKERTDWHRCVLYGPRAEFLQQYLKKGTQILVEGSVRYSSFEDKEGKKQYRTEISVNNVEFVGKKQSGSGSSDSMEYGSSDSTRAGVKSKHEPNSARYTDDDNIPF